MEIGEHQIVLFDGVCNFCNGSVNFIIDHDQDDTFRFAALQSDEGVELLKKFDIDPEETDSVILIDDSGANMYSTAALKISKHLGGIYRFGYIFMIVPAFIRDFFYKLFAKYRYRLFGRTDECRIPTPEERAKFL